MVNLDCIVGNRWLRLREMRRGSESARRPHRPVHEKQGDHDARVPGSSNLTFDSSPLGTKILRQACCSRADQKGIALVAVYWFLWVAAFGRRR